MDKLDTTMIVLIKGEEQILSIEMSGDNLPYNKFMEMIEMLLNKSSYSKHEIESYILQWAEDIRLSREN